MVIFNPPLAIDDNHPLPIFSRSGWEIPQLPPGQVEAEQRALENVEEATRLIIGSMEPARQRSLVVRSVSQRLYSCVGMIFANRRTWLEIDEILRILREDGYSKLPDTQWLSVGDVALYANGSEPTHVGLVTQLHRSKGSLLNVRLLSKWGRCGEIEHDVHDVP